MPRGTSERSPRDAIGEVLAPAFLRTLGRLRLDVRRAVGSRPGSTPMRRAVDTSGIELERHAPYSSGDEPRHLDWNAYARLDQLIVKRFRAMREAPLYVFLDTSASMAAPSGDDKFAFAMGVTVALSYIAVRHHDPAQVIAVGDHRGRPGYRASPVVRHLGTFERLRTFCAGLTPHGGSRLAAAAAGIARPTATPGLAVFVSDFLADADDWRDALRLLASKGFEVVALRPLGAGERDPSRLFRRGRLHDVESGGERIIALTARNLDTYRRALAAHLDDLAQTCRAHAARFAVCDTSLGVQHCLVAQLPQLGVLH